MQLMGHLCAKGFDIPLRMEFPQDRIASERKWYRKTFVKDHKAMKKRIPIQLLRKLDINSGDLVCGY